MRVEGVTALYNPMENATGCQKTVDHHGILPLDPWKDFHRVQETPWNNVAVLVSGTRFSEFIFPVEFATGL